MKKLTALFLVLLLTLTMLASCAAEDKGGSANINSQPTVGAPEYSEGEKGEGDGSHIDVAEDYTRKIIKTYTLSLETKSYASARDVIVNTAAALGGYVSDSTEKDTVGYQNKKVRQATFTVRVPSEKVDSYVETISENVSVLSKKLSTEDITTSYYDLQSQLESLLEQEARIKKLMDEATNYNYLLQLDDKLTTIRTQINNVNKQIQLYDKSVALSYVYVTLNEVVEYTEIEEAEPTFGKRVAEAFIDTFTGFWSFCQDMFIVAIHLLPVIIITAAVIVIHKLRKKKKKEKKEKLEAERRESEEKK